MIYALTAPPPAPAVQVQRPLLSIPMACGALNCGPDEVLQRIETGRIGWAWNIARAHSGRREIRLLAQSVAALQAGEIARSFTEEQVLQMIFGMPKRFLTGAAIHRAFHCSSELVIQLVQEESIAVVPGTRWRPGRNGSPQITWDALAAFLRRRRLQST